MHTFFLISEISSGDILVLRSISTGSVFWTGWIGRPRSGRNPSISKKRSSILGSFSKMALKTWMLYFASFIWSNYSRITFWLALSFSLSLSTSFLSRLFSKAWTSTAISKAFSSSFTLSSKLSNKNKQIYLKHNLNLKKTIIATKLPVVINNANSNRIWKHLLKLRYFFFLCWFFTVFKKLHNNVKFKYKKYLYF